PLLRRFRLGRLPGDFQVPVRGRVYYVPFATTVVLSLLVWLIGLLLYARGDRPPDPHLRQPGLQLLLRLALRERGLRQLERVRERARAGQRIAEVRLAEIGEVAAAVAAKRRPLGGGRRDDDAVVVAQRLDIAARVARGDDDHAPFDARVLQRPRERRGRERRQFERRLHGGEPMILVAVRAQVEEQHVLVAVHLLGSAPQRALEIGDARDREFLERVVAVDERDRVPGGGEALVEQAAHEAHLFYEHVLACVGREADEIK